MKLKDILVLVSEDSRVGIEYYPTPNLKATIKIDMDDRNALDEAISQFGDSDVMWLQSDEYRLTIQL